MIELKTVPRRRLASWIDAFYSYTEHLPSPALFRKWAGIAAVAGALERKVWIRLPAYDANLYPNMFTVIVGPPGVGKTVVTDKVRELWGKLDDHFVAASSLTKASLVDDLRDAQRDVIRPRDTPPTVTFNSLLIAANELGVLIPGWENDFMNVLTDIYDCKVYSERRRSKELKFKLDAPQLNLLAATTPSYLNNVLPEGAWDQGFLSRTLIIFSSETMIRPLFDAPSTNSGVFNDLVADLLTIGNLYGKMSWTPEAAAAISAWHTGGGEPKPDHPKLLGYTTRRTTHLIKLCMVASVSRSDDLIIERSDFDIALDWLIEAEFYMPDVFKAMTVGGDARAIEECWYFVYRAWLKEKAPIAKARVTEYLMARVPIHNVERIIEAMSSAGILNQKFIDSGVGFEPRPFRR